MDPLLLITNSEWEYTEAMMTYAFDRFLPNGMTWRDIFDAVFVAARKPEFFTRRQPAFEVMEGGLLSPVVGPLTVGKAYWGGDARMVEELFATDGALQDEAAFKLASEIHVDQLTEIARMKLMLDAL